MNKKYKDPILPYTIATILFITYSSIIGWQYVHILFATTVIFSVFFYALFKLLPENSAGWIMLASFFIAMVYGSLEEDIIHKSMMTILIGCILGTNLYSTQRKNAKTSIKTLRGLKNQVLQDSNNRELTIEFTTQEKKGIFGRVKTINLVHLKIGKEWATYDLKDLDRESFEEGQLAESVASSDGPVFIANVDWAEEHSLFHQQVAGVPAHWWVLCFMNFETDPVQAAFSPEKFEEFLTLVHSG